MIYNLFPTPLYNSRSRSPSSLYSELHNALADITWIKGAGLDDTHSITTATYFDDIIASAGLKLFEKELEYHVLEFAKDLDFVTYPSQRSSWLAEYRTGEYSSAHDHGTADISGVYYYDTTGQDGNIFFERPGVAHTHWPCSQLGDRFEITPVSGMILLFPGWLRHGVTRNQTASVRRVLSFNLWFDRTAWVKDQLTPSK
jgi:uncharacterized protein (TIGR02466 family)